MSLSWRSNCRRSTPALPCSQSHSDAWGSGGSVAWATSGESLWRTPRSRLQMRSLTKPFISWLVRINRFGERTGYQFVSPHELNLKGNHSDERQVNKPNENTGAEVQIELESPMILLEHHRQPQLIQEPHHQNDPESQTYPTRECVVFVDLIDRIDRMLGNG